MGYHGHTKDIHPHREPCTTVQSTEVGAKPSSCTPWPWRVPDMENADKPSNPIATKLHIKSQVWKKAIRSHLLKPLHFAIVAVNLVWEHSLGMCTWAEWGIH